MPAAFDAREFQSRLERLDALLRETESIPDPAARVRLQEIVQTLLDLHGWGLDRLLGHVADAGAAGQAALDACARDDVVSGLLLLHGLHPLDTVRRVRQALDDVRPLLHARGGSVEALDVTDGKVRLRLQGNSPQSAWSAATLRQTIEEAIHARAPEVVAVEITESTQSHTAIEDSSVRVSLPVL
jgi:Fe-S cluster biogenesis protein NfuA